MTQHNDIERLLDHWFSEGPDQAADRVLDIVADRIDRQSQLPAWRLHWRSSPVNTYAKIAVAAAAVLIVALVGYNLLPGSSTGVGGPAPTASPPTAPTAVPSTGPSPSAAFPAWYKPETASGGAGILSSGSQTTRTFAPAFTYSVPEGWVNDLDESIGYGLFPNTPANEAEYGLSGDMAHGIFIVSVGTPYFFCESWEKTRGTAAERIAFLGASDTLAASNPVDVTVGGLTGKQVDIRVDPGSKATCPGDPPGHDLSGQRTRALYLDTPDRGVIAIAVGSKQPDGHEAFLAEAMPIVESFDFTP
jgi:hypothetical protein